jgi:hypothetical protein
MKSGNFGASPHLQEGSVAVRLLPNRCMCTFRYALAVCLVVESPVASIKIIDTSALQLRQDIQHGFACGCH